MHRRVAEDNWKDTGGGGGERWGIDLKRFDDSQSQPWEFPRKVPLCHVTHSSPHYCCHFAPTASAPQRRLRSGPTRLQVQVGVCPLSQICTCRALLLTNVKRDSAVSWFVFFLLLLFHSLTTSFPWNPPPARPFVTDRPCHVAYTPPCRVVGDACALSSLYRYIGPPPPSRWQTARGVVTFLTAPHPFHL